jgi:hypothetical protein
MGTTTDSEQNFLIGKKPFETSLLIMTLPRRQFGDIFNIIREIRGLMAGFFAPQIPKQQFLIGFLVLSIVDRAKEEARGDDAAALSAPR